MKKSAVVFLIALLSYVSAFSLEFDFAIKYPDGPNIELTPGSLCLHPTEYRYPEKIPYCRRNVESELKREIIKAYDRELGFQIGTMNRQDFKIDHYIPLCAGGSNEEDNLWPQHKSVYNITDPLEPLICGKMAEGRLRQKDAVAIVMRAKNNLKLVPQILKDLNAL